MRKVLINIVRILYPIVVYFVIAAGIYLAIRILEIRTDYQNAIVILLIQQVITSIAIVWIYRIQSLKSPAEHRNYRLSDLGIKNGILIAASTYFIMNTLALGVVISGLNKLFPGYSEMMEYLAGSPVLLQLIATVIMAPVLEEVLCRGILYKRMREISGFWLSAAVSSVVWAVMHLNMIQGITAFLLGIFLAYLYEKFKMLRLTILCHAFYNLIPTIFAYLIPKDSPGPAATNAADPWAYLPALAVNMAVTVWLVTLLYRTKFPREAIHSR